MCMYCKNSTTINSTTTHVVNYKNCIIVIKNVPCLECDQCGEKYYTDEVAEHLELIVDMAKKLMQEIAVSLPQVANNFGGNIMLVFPPLLLYTLRTIHLPPSYIKLQYSLIYINICTQPFLPPSTSSL